MELLCFTNNSTETRMACSMMRDHYSTQSGKKTKIGYNKINEHLVKEPDYLIAKDFIKLNLPPSGQSRLGYNTLKKAKSNWNATKGKYFNDRKNLEKTNKKHHDTLDKFSKAI